MSDDPRVLYETRDDGRIAVVTMNRARYRNPLSIQMMRALDEAFARAADDDEVRVIILRGDGPSFSSGHDLGSPDAAEMRAEMHGASFSKRVARSREMDLEPLMRFRNIPKPTIAMVQGACIYAAWMLAASMDVIFAAEDAQFLATNFSVFTVPWDIGARQAKYLMYDNRFLDGRTAKEAGIVQEVHPLDRIEDEAMAYARRVAKNDPFQLRMMKHSIHQMQEVQGFTAHIQSSFADRMVRAANVDVAITEQQGDPEKRRLYVSVERARANREAGPTE